MTSRKASTTLEQNDQYEQRINELQEKISENQLKKLGKLAIINRT